MIVAIHQPHFFPWLGYLHRMARADAFVVLDHVQFERRNYQNRTMIRMEGEARWLTAPVIQRSQKERIVEKLVDNREEGARGWGPGHLRTLRHAYRAAPFAGRYLGELRALFEAEWQRLADLDQASLDFLRGAFGIRTEARAGLFERRLCDIEHRHIDKAVAQQVVDQRRCATADIDKGGIARNARAANQFQRELGTGLMPA